MACTPKKLEHLRRILKKPDRKAVASKEAERRSEKSVMPYVEPLEKRKPVANFYSILLETRETILGVIEGDGEKEMATDSWSAFSSNVSTMEFHQTLDDGQP